VLIPQYDDQRWLASAQRDLRQTAGQHEWRVRGRNGWLALLGNGVKGTGGPGLKVVGAGLHRHRGRRGALRAARGAGQAGRVPVAPAAL
jgi:hypothetical protein